LSPGHDKLESTAVWELRGEKKEATSAQFWCTVNPFRINTSKSVSKRTTSSPFRINTYEKTGGWGITIFQQHTADGSAIVTSLSRCFIASGP
jgi:hypothetical protein